MRYNTYLNKQFGELINFKTKQTEYNLTDDFFIKFNQRKLLKPYARMPSRKSLKHILSEEDFNKLFKNDN